MSRTCMSRGGSLIRPSIPMGFASNLQRNPQKWALLSTAVPRPTSCCPGSSVPNPHCRSHSSPHKHNINFTTQSLRDTQLSEPICKYHALTSGNII
jgi:hypothetical protein